MTWFWIVLAILYVLSSFDLIPDMLVGWGWIDDLAVLYMLYRYLRRTGVIGGSPPNRPGGNSQGRDTRQTQSGPGESRDPYEVLEIPRSASSEEIHSAYRRLAAQYHPDKVAHLGEEFREMAEKRFIEIQQAYDLLMGKK
ncbi:MAG: DnaJ domain-containing protein [Desulfosarcinaceae bacterium]